MLLQGQVAKITVAILQLRMTLSGDISAIQVIMSALTKFVINVNVMGC